MMDGRDWLMLAALSLVWGGSFFFVEIAVAALPPFTVVFCRVALAALILLLALHLSGSRMPSSKAAWLGFLGMGFLNNALPFSLFAWGQTEIASGLAAILNATMPLFTVGLAHWLTTDERLTPGRAVGVVIGLAGVAAMIGGDALDGLGAGLAAQFACLAAAFSYACASLYGRRFRTAGLSPFVAAAGQLCASALLLAPMAAMEAPWKLPVPGAPVLGALLGVATLSTALAYLLYFQILARAGSTNIALVTFLVPVSAILLGTLFLGERLSGGHVLGMTAIAIGLAAIDGRPAARLRGLLESR
jgi:drug/metabolite transporter (DMT)-like permease